MINYMTGKHIVACYGSLKEDFYNHGALGKDANLLGKTSYAGVMYLHGSYPNLYKPINNKCDGTQSPFCYHLARTHILEVYEIGDTANANIEMMEFGAGYYSEEIDTDWGKATIYLNPHEVYDPELDEWIGNYSQELLKSKGI